MAELALATERSFYAEVLRLERAVADLEHDNLALRAELGTARSMIGDLNSRLQVEAARANAASAALTDSRAEVKRLKSHIWDED